MRMNMHLTATVLATAVVLTGCASGSDTASTSGSTETVKFEKKEPMKFGYSVMDLQEPYFQAYAAGIESQAGKNNIEVIVADQKSSQQEQVSNSANLINQNISALIISPIQPDALPATINAAHEAKIPVIIGDVGATGDYDTYILSDNVAGGKIAADYVIEQFADKPGNHKIAIVGTAPGIVSGAERAQGFKDQIAAAAPNIQIVGEIAGQSIEGAFKAGQDLLSANPDLEAVFATNSNNVQGVSRAAETANKADLIIMGFNGDPVELDLIAAGKQTATVAQDPYGQGVAAVDAALALLDGKTPEFTDAPKKTLLLPTKLVDKSNLDVYRQELADKS